MLAEIGLWIWYGIGLVCLVVGVGGLALLYLSGMGNSSEE